jgi:hypothetical protein
MLYSSSIVTKDRQVYVASAVDDRLLLDVAAPTAVVCHSYAALLRPQTRDTKQLLAGTHYFGAPHRLFCKSRRSSCTRLHRGNMRMPNRGEGQAGSPRRLNRVRSQQSSRYVCRLFVMNEAHFLAWVERFHLDLQRMWSLWKR